MIKFFVYICAFLQFVNFTYAQEPLRPQEPLPPYSYEEEEVNFENNLESVNLAGTLTLPRSSRSFPAVILIQGSSPHDRDYSSDGHKVFLVWADYLTRAGFAVLRFDKRGNGKSTGDYSISTLKDSAQDVLAAIEYLKSRNDINPQQIGLIGHSEGGMVAFLAASKSDDIAFVLSMAAPCVNAEEIVCNQEALLMRVDGISEDLIIKTHSLRRQMFTLLKREKDRRIAEKKLREIIIQYFDSLSPSQKELAEAYFGTVEQQIQMFNSARFRYWLVYDPTIALKQVTVPIFALNGKLDLIVTPQQNLRLIAQTLENEDHKDFMILEIPQLNHAFQTCQTGSIKEYEKIEETTSPFVLNIMSEWLLRVCKQISSI